MNTENNVKVTLHEDVIVYIQHEFETNSEIRVLFDKAINKRSLWNYLGLSNARTIYFTEAQYLKVIQTVKKYMSNSKFKREYINALDELGHVIFKDGK